MKVLSRKVGRSRQAVNTRSGVDRPVMRKWSSSGLRGLCGKFPRRIEGGDGGRSGVRMVLRYDARAKC